MPINYNEAAETYARNRSIHPGVFQGLQTNLSAESRVLEVGCGTGNYIIALRELLDCPCWGVDPSENMLAQARSRGSAVRFGPGRAEALPFCDGSFDLVFNVDVIHHVSDRPAFYREAGRVLSPGGWVCTVTDSEEIIRRRAPLSVYFPETVEPELRRYPPISELKDQMLAAGFGALREDYVEWARPLASIQGYLDKSYSSLHLIPADAFERGAARLRADFERGPVQGLSMYILLSGQKGS